MTKIKPGENLTDEIFYSRKIPMYSISTCSGGRTYYSMEYHVFVLSKLVSIATCFVPFVLQVGAEIKSLWTVRENFIGKFCFLVVVSYCRQIISCVTFSRHLGVLVTFIIGRFLLQCSSQSSL